VTLRDSDFEKLRQDALKCERCALAAGRTHVVFGEGRLEAPILLIGEGPGQQEDESGRPFIGRSGQLLRKLLNEAGLRDEQDCYITNIVKCRPPENRAPKPIEIEACFGHLTRQIELLQPQVIVLIGATALRAILGNKQPISKIRGQWLDAPNTSAKVMAIFHPAYLLRNSSMLENTPRRVTLDDLKRVKHCVSKPL
jgi:uracil-DNA glycosylase